MSEPSACGRLTAIDAELSTQRTKIQRETKLA
jgi:hypothetical protein